VEIGFDNIGWPIFLELDVLGIKISQTEDQTNNQKSKIKNSKLEEQPLSFMYEITEWDSKIPEYYFSYLQASACF